MAPPAADVTVVIPVRNGGPDVDACLAAIVPQCSARSAEVIVVDDGSTDDSRRRAERAGAHVVALPRSGGPYEARNQGWARCTTELVAFTDVRNRAAEGWLDGLRRPFSDPLVAVAGGLVEIGGDQRLAHRLARRQSHVDPRPLLADPYLPFVTTSSMAVRRSALEAVGGFAPRRSGGDADLCWRIQQQGLGSVVLAPDSVMVCEPRASVTAVWRQWRRYARSHVEVRRAHARAGAVSDNAGSVTEQLREALDRLRSPGRDPALEVVDTIRRLGYEAAYRRARHRTGGGGP